MNRGSHASIRLGGSHGYRFDGDRVRLHADFETGPHLRCAGLSLQLWASERPLDGASRLADLRSFAQPIASTGLELPSPLRPQVQSVDVWANAWIPLQGRSLYMTMLLVDEDESIRDHSTYPALEVFDAPRWEGSIGYRIDGSEVTITAEKVFNPRTSSNRSGDLSVELWALQGPHRGDPVNGHLLARTPLSPLDGQCFYGDLMFRTGFQPPPAGDHRVALFLREWTVARGFVTRDVRTFDHSYCSPDATPAATPEAAPAAPPPKAVAVAAPKAVVAPVPTPAPKAAPTPVKAPTTLVASAVDEDERDPSEQDPRVSIQDATAEQLARATKLSPGLARAIVKGRPYSSVDDLLKVRGLGAKTLRRIRGLIRV